MAKLTKEELNKRIDALELDDDTKISLMEDISDSINDDSEINSLREEISSKDSEIADLKEKYKSRFLESTETAKDIAEEAPAVEADEEEKVIDVTEI